MVGHRGHRGRHVLADELVRDVLVEHCAKVGRYVIHRRLTYLSSRRAVRLLRLQHTTSPARRKGPRLPRWDESMARSPQLATRRRSEVATLACSGCGCDRHTRNVDPDLHTTKI